VLKSWFAEVDLGVNSSGHEVEPVEVSGFIGSVIAEVANCCDFSVFDSNVGGGDSL